MKFPDLLFPLLVAAAHSTSSSEALSSSASAPLLTLASQHTATSFSKQAVVVGGGPVGLATALTLSNPPHCYNVTVLEKAPSLATTYDPTRAYLYNINRRGLSWVDQFECVRVKLEDKGSNPSSSGGFGNIVYIPSDPKKPIPLITDTVRLDTIPIKSQRRYWIPRHQMVQILEECCAAQEKQRLSMPSTTMNENLGAIELVKAKQVISVGIANESTHLLTVFCADNTQYAAALVVAADGMDSTVRKLLCGETDSSVELSSKIASLETASSSWLHSSARSFRVRRYRSPSTGLRMKSLQFPPGFELTNTTGEKISTNSETIYVFRGINNGPRDYVSLGLLPVKDPTLIRPANINTRPNHVLWSMSKGSDVKQFFERNYPRVKWEEWVSNEEWDRFASAVGTSYPYCQYSPGSAVVSPTDLTGVVLVGDACHAFPPDIGQGINAGLEDVVALDRALKGERIATTKSSPSSDATTTSTLTLGQALTTYQANRGPEHAALIRLARCGAPYQYRQAWFRDRIGRFFWTMNVAFRMLLNKVSSGYIPPAAMLIAQDHTLSFYEVMRRASITTRALKISAIVLFCLLWSKKRLLCLFYH